MALAALMSARLLVLGCFVLGCGTADRVGASPRDPAPPSSAGAAGAAAETPDEVDETPPVSIAGRWAMFHFEDPVAVELIQDGAQLTGLGCDAGLSTPELDVAADDYCGPILGEVTGNRARFELTFRLGHIAAAVTVSADASRMTGDFTLSSQSAPNLSWLRFADGPGLQRRIDESPEAYPIDGQLRLVEASPGASEFQFGRTYRISSRWDIGIHGDLGNFWHTEEAAFEPGEPIRVGPVPVTNPERPISLEIERQGTAITRVTAVAGSGASYVFLPSL